MTKLPVRSLLLAVTLLVTACANGTVVTRVDQAALFRPNLIHYGAAGNMLNLEIHGAALPAGTTSAQLADAMTLPGQYHPIRFALTDGGTSSGDNIRMVLIVNPMVAPLAETVCRVPGAIDAQPKGRLAIMAVLCAGGRYAAKGHIVFPQEAVTAPKIAAGLRGLFADMLQRPVQSPNSLLFAKTGLSPTGGMLVGRSVY